VCGAFIHIALLSGSFRNLSLARSEKLVPAILYLEPTRPANRISIATPIWGEQEALTGLNLQSNSLPDVLSHSTLQPGLAYHMCKRKEK
jgi:hypothetical protein